MSRNTQSNLALKAPQFPVDARHVAIWRIYAIPASGSETIEVAIGIIVDGEVPATESLRTSRGEFGELYGEFEFWYEASANGGVVAADDTVKVERVDNIEVLNAGGWERVKAVIEEARGFVERDPDTVVSPSLSGIPGRASWTPFSLAPEAVRELPQFVTKLSDTDWGIAFQYEGETLVAFHLTHGITMDFGYWLPSLYDVETTDFTVRDPAWVPTRIHSPPDA